MSDLYFSLWKAGKYTGLYEITGIRVAGSNPTTHAETPTHIEPRTIRPKW